MCEDYPIAMIIFIIKNTLRLFLLLAIIYTGNSYIIEDGFEKTEKTEKSEEGLHSNHREKGLQRTTIHVPLNFQFLSSNFYLSKEISLVRDRTSYHVNHLYLTSYLDIHV